MSVYFVIQHGHPVAARIFPEAWAFRLHPNSVATFPEGMIPLALAMAIGEGRPWLRVFYGFCAARWSEFLPELRNLPVLLLILIIVLWPAQNTVRRIVKGDNQTAKEFAHHIETELPPDVLIASEEWEIDFLTNRAYLHHLAGFGDTFIKRLQLGYPLEDFYDVAAFDSEYIIDSPYNKGVGFISPRFLES